MLLGFLSTAGKLVGCSLSANRETCCILSSGDAHDSQYTDSFLLKLNTSFVAKYHPVYIVNHSISHKELCSRPGKKQCTL